MQNDLFNKKPKPAKKPSLQLSLEKHDKNSIEERLKRLKYLKKVFPKNFAFAADPETVYIFDEVKTTFISGAFISTILLSQAFIERWLQHYYKSLGLGTIANKGLKAMVNHAEQAGTLHPFLLNKIDDLRKKRNPFVHLKSFEHEFNLTQRMITDNKEDKPFRHPNKILYDDAKEALSLMYTILITRLE